ncbi:MAG: PQQ-binding-like beta-propeller repeat protein [Candidatus Brocadiae bacterium]|nr:PQQ-binding-like beta-propeller repeat protein [Candidatus Brocadiia bacterium]
MSTRANWLRMGWLALVMVALVLAPRVARAADAQQILKATGIQGGFVIHVGCGDGKLTAALRASQSYVVHGIDTDAATVAKARQHIQSLGLYGGVTADRWDGKRLPYIDNLANLVVAEQAVPQAEVMRVLCPQGVAYVKNGGQWAKAVKPRPSEIDEWTHYLHDATNNAVSQDQVVAPLHRMQWCGSPRWARHHDHMSSISSCVTTGQRLFYIFDEGSTASVVLPSKWFLIGRDAFNGTVLWKRPIADWFTQLWPLKSGPALLTRRLVAVGDEVYVTLGLRAPVSALDAATGKTLRTYAGTAGTDEIIHSDGVLFLVVNPQPDTRWGGSRANVGDIRRQVRDARWAGMPGTVMAVQAATGKTLWRMDTTVSPSTLAADARHAYVHDGQKVLAIDRKTGQQAWASEPLPVWSPQAVQSWFVPCLVLYKDVVLWAGGEKMIPHRGGRDAMTALAVATGKTLWSAPHGPTGYQSAEDLLVAGGLVWSGATTNGSYDGIFTGHDPRTGEVKKTFAPDTPEGTYWFHHRCHRGKATENYLLVSRTGIEYIDIKQQKWILHHWTRGACLTGVVPANGMIYAPQHDCACYPEAKTFGFNALAPASASLDALRKGPAGERLERGPAYDPIGDRQSAVGKSSDWPTYRGSATRAGSTKTAVPAELKPVWEKGLGGTLSSVAVAGGKLYVASVDTHTVMALDAANGELLWSYTAGGRVDSPPTIHEGLCLFGSADGTVYCLRASDGVLAWRFRAAPVDQRHMYFEQVESVWPVHGSILVQDGEAYFVAGRSMFLDGGIHFYRLDAKTGRVLSHQQYDAQDPTTGKELQARHQTLQMPVALPDVLSSDGERVYMRSQVLDREGKRLALGPHSGQPAGQGAVQRGAEAHLFAPYGFLDSEWFHRSYWVVGRSFSGGHAGYHQAGRFAPAGRILAADEKTVYGYARKPQYLRWTTTLEYHLFATSREAPEVKGLAAPSQRRGKAAAGSWITVDNAPGLDPSGKPLAVEAWVNAARPDGVVVARGGPAHGYALFLQKGQPQFAVRVSDKVYQVGAKQAVVGKWTHLAGVLAPEKTLEIYVNGKLAGTGKAAGFIAEDPAQTMEIGADDAGGVADYRSPFALTGLIDEVRVYFGRVTAAEIAKHHATPGDVAAKEAKLVLNFSFEKGKARDASGQNHHGKAGAVQAAKGRIGGAMKFTGRGGAARRGSRHLVQYHWSKDAPPVVARAMVLAGNTLFVAGPPDVVDEEAAVRSLDAPAIAASLAAQSDALDGKKGAVLLAISAADGTTLATHKLAAPPAWDGMAAAGGRLYLTTVDGKVLCLGGAK